MILFSERLRELRIEKQISQSELAKILGVSQRSISSWETGYREPDYEMLEQLADFFDVTMGYLLGTGD